MRPLEVETRPVEEGFDENQDEEKPHPNAPRSLLQRMADDKRNYMEKSSIAGNDDMKTIFLINQTNFANLF